MEKSEGKRALERARCRWKNNIETDLEETGFEDTDWIHLTHSR
jgi:hypothetical protein